MRNATVPFLGDGLRARRRMSRLSQTDLAALVGTTRQAVSLWERGLRRPRPGTMARVIAALGETK